MLHLTMYVSTYIEGIYQYESFVNININGYIFIWAILTAQKYQFISVTAVLRIYPWCS